MTRLVLNKETLQTLNEGNLQQIGGGMYIVSLMGTDGGGTSCQATVRYSIAMGCKTTIIYAQANAAL